MQNEYIKSIQNKLINLLSSNNQPLSLLAKDNCSELSRLVGSWILKDYPSSNVLIILGEDIYDIKDLNHDILIVNYENKFLIIDPSIWQFFKESESILINITDSMKNVYDELKLKYGGHWKISEKLESTSKNQIDEWIETIQKNIKNSQ